MNTKDTPQQARFREIVRDMLEHGEKPTPTFLLKRYPHERFVTDNHPGTSGPCLSHGRLTKVRAEEFERAGWIKNERTGRWQPGTLPTTSSGGRQSPAT